MLLATKSLVRRSIPPAILAVAAMIAVGPGCSKGKKSEESTSPSTGKTNEGKSLTGKSPQGKTGGAVLADPRPGPQPQDPQAQVYAALDHAQRLLKEDKLTDFMQLYLPFSALRDLRYGPRDEGGIEASARQMAKDPSFKQGFQLQIAMLRKMKPEFRNSNHVAVFKFVSPRQEVRAKTVPLVKAVNADVKITGYGDDLKAAIKKAVADLEKGDIAAYLRNMLPAIELQLNDVDLLAKRIEASKSKRKSATSIAERILNDLKALETIAPKMEDGGKTAVFEKPFAGPKALANGSKAKQVIKFQKSNGHWRLYDNTTAMRAAAKNMKRVIASSSTTIIMEKLGRNWRFGEDPSKKKRDRGFGGYSETEKSAPRSYKTEAKTRASKTIERKTDIK